MRLPNFYLFILFSLMSSQICFAQDPEKIQPAKNWWNEHNIYYEPMLYFSYKRFSEQDVIKFREKLDLLKTSQFDEWEGIYFNDLEDLGHSQLRWEADAGFLSFYIYTCLPELQSLNYGKIANSPDAVKLLPEFAENSPRKQTPIKYIKVKWNDRNYLVEESALSAFAEKAVGIYVEQTEGAGGNYGKWARYWMRGDLQKPLVGLPEFPANYKKFQRFPIEAKIVSIGRRVVEEKTLGNTSYTEAAFYSVTIDAGKNNGVKEGMKFEISEIESEVFITQVNSKTSVGLIHRDIDDSSKADVCRDDSFNEIACPKIKASLKVKTQIGNFWF